MSLLDVSGNESEPLAALMRVVNHRCDELSFVIGGNDLIRKERLIL